MSTVGKAEGNRLKLTYRIFVVNIKGKKCKHPYSKKLGVLWRHHSSKMCLD